MTPWWWFVLGLLVGWLVEWVIDWIYWRGRQAAFIHDIETLRGGEQKLRTELDNGRKALQRLQDDLGPLRAENDRLKAENAGLAGLRIERDRLSVELALAGEATARCNAEATTLKARVVDLNGAIEKLRADLVARSAELAGLSGQLTTAGGERDQLRTELTERNGEIKQLHMAASVAATTPTLGVAIGEDELAKLRLDLDKLHERNARLNLALRSERFTSALERPEGADQLIAIEGIGPFHQSRLYNSGVLTFGQLAAQSPARVREVALADNDDDSDVESWIAAAQARVVTAQRDPLIDINGVGPVYQQRLYDAGIFTFEQFAGLTPAQIYDTLKPQEWQRNDAEEWIGEARGFAEQVRAGTYQRKED